MKLPSGGTRRRRRGGQTPDQRQPLNLETEAGENLLLEQGGFLLTEN